MKQESSKANKTQAAAMETIKLLANHVIELRSEIEELKDHISDLQVKSKSREEAQQEFVNEFKMYQIDNKDMHSQMKRMKDVLEQIQRYYDEEKDLPSFEDIAERFYPGFNSNPMFQETRAAETKAKAELSYERQFEKPEHKTIKIIADAEEQEKAPTSVFKRLPKFLNLD